MFFRITLIGALLVGAASCGSITRPDREPYYSGIITDVDPGLGATVPGDSALITKVLVKDPGDQCGIISSVSEDTEILVAGRAGTVADLVVGAMADVWYTGPILDSCPGQGLVEAIEIE